jgi:hypothetical protein
VFQIVHISTIWQFLFADAAFLCLYIAWKKKGEEERGIELNVVLKFLTWDRKTEIAWQRWVSLPFNIFYCIPSKA